MILSSNLPGVWGKERCKTRKPMKKISTPSPPTAVKEEPDKEAESTEVPSTSAAITSTVQIQFSTEQEALCRLVSDAFHNALKMMQTLPQQVCYVKTLFACPQSLLKRKVQFVRWIGIDLF